MTRLSLFTILSIVFFLSSCTTEENDYYITEEVVQEGAYFNEVRFEANNTVINEANPAEVGNLIFDCQDLKINRIDVDIELLDNGEDVSQYIESVTLTKNNTDHDLYIDELDIDDEEYYIEWKTVNENQHVESLDSYKLVITPKSSFPISTEAEIDIDLRMENLFGSYEYINIRGSIDNLYFVKN